MSFLCKCVKSIYATNSDKKKVALWTYSKVNNSINPQRKKSTSKKYYRAHQNESKSYFAKYYEAHENIMKGSFRYYYDTREILLENIMTLRLVKKNEGFF